MNLPDFPRHKAFTLEHNVHLVFYQTMSEYFMFEAVCFQNEAARTRCIATGELWVLTWYPDTPVGSYRIGAPTLEELLAYANEEKKP